MDSHAATVPAAPTRGPWEIEISTSRKISICGAPETDRVICFIAFQNLGDPYGWDSLTDEDRANAAAIVASVNGYRGLIAAITAYSEDCRDSENHEIADHLRAILARCPTIAP